ncbi:SPW repeat domain-containing protein [Natrinema soli]|uniref:SPW repeat domain-containing protein n=1 Tax=Natrinema soli TaxID=1930624 RepID=UPI003CCDC8E3
MGPIARYTAGSNVVLGCWLVASSIIFGMPAISRWNAVLVGLVIVPIAGYNFYKADRRHPLNSTGAGLVTVLGFWLIVEPFVLRLEGLPLWHDVILGTLIASFGSYNTYIAAITGQTSSFRIATG